MSLFFGRTTLRSFALVEPLIDKTAHLGWPARGRVNVIADRQCSRVAGRDALGTLLKVIPPGLGDPQDLGTCRFIEEGEAWPGVHEINKLRQETPAVVAILLADWKERRL